MENIYTYEQAVHNMLFEAVTGNNKEKEFEKLQRKLDKLRLEGYDAGKTLRQISEETMVAQGQLEDMCVAINGGHDFDDGICVECMAVDDREPIYERYEDMDFDNHYFGPK